MANKLKDTSPRPRIGKTAKDTRVARLIDINKVVTELNTELTAKDVEILNLQNQIDNIPVSGYTETTVNITSAQMTSGSSSVELFPIPNGSTLRSLEVFAVYTEGSIPYTTSGGNYYIIGDLNNGDFFIQIHKDLFTWWVTEGVPVVNNYVWNSNMIDNGTPDSSIIGGHLTGTIDNAVYIRMNSLFLADGNGTLDLHCKYSFITL